MSSTASDPSFVAARSKSTSTFISALVISTSAFGVQVLIFLVLRTSIKKIYSPRTYLPHRSKRAKPVSIKPWGWILPVLKTPSKTMIPTAGLDAYMYMRFLKMMVYIFGPSSILTSAVLLPLNSVGKISSGLNSYAFGNIKETQQIRYVGHLICAYAVSAWVVFLIQREMANYVELRQKYLTSPGHMDLPQSRTVLVTGVPQKLLSESALKSLTTHLPGGIKQIWISRELEKLPELYHERVKRTLMLEAAETKICKVVVLRSKAIAPQLSSSSETATSFSRELKEECSKHIDPVDELVPRKSRPAHRLGFMGLFGKKVDTLDWCKDEIVRLTMEIEAERKRLDQHRPHNSAFIEFNNWIGAQIFSQIVLYHKPLRLSKRYVDAAPEDIIWDNLNINPYDERLRNMFSWVLTVGLVILWSFPVAFIGSLSNVTSLCTTVRWLSWLCNTGHHLQDIIQGILPPVLLALIFLILPMILRLIARFSGVPRISEIELILMTRYYIFLVIHGFVVTTLSSGLTAAIPALSKDPGQAVTILSENLPKASIFFMTYMVTTSLTGSAGSLLQVFDLIFYYLKLSVFASTPRSVFNISYTMTQPQFGTLFPQMTLLATIGLAYSIIAPIMSILAVFAFSLYWLVYKYLFLFVYDIPAAHETGGRFFPLAMNHIFIGLYFSQICLTGLFFLARDAGANSSSIAEGSLMIVLTTATLFCHLLIRNSYQPLTTFVPLNMIEESMNAHFNGSEPKAEGDSETRVDGKFSPSETPEQNHHRWSSRALPQALISNSLSFNAMLDNDAQQQECSNSKAVKAKDFANQDPTQTLTSPVNCSTSPTQLLSPKVIDLGSEKSNSTSLNELLKFPEQGRTAFIHPAAWENVRPIWVPDDPCGLAKLEVEDMVRRNIPASLVGAGISRSGKVFVTRSPPENAEVIEYKRDKTHGIFALPVAIGGVARAAGEKIGGKVSTMKASQSMHSRKESVVSTAETTGKLSISTSSKHNLGSSIRNPLLASIKRKNQKASKRKDTFSFPLPPTPTGDNTKSPRLPDNLDEDDLDGKGKGRRSEESELHGSVSGLLISPVTQGRIEKDGESVIEDPLRGSEEAPVNNFDQKNELDLTDWKDISARIAEKRDLTMFDNHMIEEAGEEDFGIEGVSSVGNLHHERQKSAEELLIEDEQVSKLESGESSK